MPRHIAIVEDEPSIAANYRDALQRQGFAVSLHANRGGAWEAFQQKLPDLAIIDVGLEDEIEGGFDLCRDVNPGVGVGSTQATLTPTGELDAQLGVTARVHGAMRARAREPC